MSLTIRPIEKHDVEVCGKIGYEAHKTVSAAHGYPSEQPTEEHGIGLVKMLLDNPNSFGVLAEAEGTVLGSIFLHKFPPSPVAVIGPLTVRPSAQGGVGRALMDAVLTQAGKQHMGQVRLVQSPSHIRSFALYTKCGFALREPLFLMQGQPLTNEQKSDDAKNVRPVRNATDIASCNEMCRKVHGFTREGELRQAIDHGAALMIERGGQISGYAAGIGLFGHAVAKSNNDLKALISSAPTITGPGFFVPARNHELMNWLFDCKFRIEWPANLMTFGPYQEPAGLFLPSLAY
ncbi:MAG: GNAT family N-acetyltransferase [Nitrososphaera sp.]